MKKPLEFEQSPSTNKDMSDHVAVPESMTPQDMLLTTCEIAQRPEFPILYKGEPTQVRVLMAEAPTDTGVEVGSDGFSLRKFTSSMSTSKASPAIWTPSVGDRPWRLAERKEGTDPETGKKFLNEDLTSGVLQRYFNLLEGQALREDGLQPAPKEAKAKQLSTITIWKLMDPSITDQAMETLIIKVRNAYQKLFDEAVDTSKIDELTGSFMAMVNVMRSMR